MNFYRKPANGDNPKIHLELDYQHSVVQSAFTVLNNKQRLLFESPRPKFDRTTLLHNVNRIKHFLPKGSTINKMEKSYEDIIGWKEPARTVKFFVFYMFFVYYFHIWWLPVILLYFFFKNWKTKSAAHTSLVKALSVNEDDDDEEEEAVDEEQKRSFMKSLDGLQKILLEIQEKSGVVASYFERVHNLFHHEETFLSLLMCGLLIISACILFIFGLRQGSYI